MLMDVLGIAIAFITIILLLSVLVTAAVQASQAVLRLRGRNLLIGLAAAILSQQKGKTARVSYSDRLKAKRDAMNILNTRSADPMNGVGAGASKLTSLLRYYVIGPKVSLISPEDLKAGLTEWGSFNAQQIDEIKTGFERLEPHMAKRFQKVARGWSLVWAVVVAFVMQVSTPALLNKLGSNAEYREKILANTNQELGYAGEAISRLDYESAAATALEQLSERHPDLRERIDQASGVGTNKRFIVDELRLVLEVWDVKGSWAPKCRTPGEQVRRGCAARSPLHTFFGRCFWSCSTCPYWLSSLRVSAAPIPAPQDQLIHLELCVVEGLFRMGDLAQPNRGSNHLKQEQLVRPERFELPTFWFVARRSIQLSYGRLLCLPVSVSLTQRGIWRLPEPVVH